MTKVALSFPHCHDMYRIGKEKFKKAGGADLDVHQSPTVKRKLLPLHLTRVEYHMVYSKAFMSVMWLHLHNISARWGSWLYIYGWGNWISDWLQSFSEWERGQETVVYTIAAIHSFIHSDKSLPGNWQDRGQAVYKAKLPLTSWRLQPSGGERRWSEKETSQSLWTA